MRQFNVLPRWQNSICALGFNPLNYPQTDLIEQEQGQKTIKAHNARYHQTVTGGLQQEPLVSKKRAGRTSSTKK
jgi:hypothetical protein